MSENSTGQSSTPQAKTETKGGIPRDDKELMPWSGNFVDWVVLNAPKMDLSLGKLAIIEGHHTTYAADMGKLAGGNSSKYLEERKEESKALMVADFQGLIDFELKNPVFTKADLIAAGVESPDPAARVKDTQIFESPVPEFQNRQRNVVAGRTRCQNTTHWRIPVEKHYRNVEYRGKVLDSENMPTPTVEECDRYGSSSKHRFTLDLGSGHSGKWFIVYVQYTNHFPIPGPWSGPYGGTIL